MVHSTGLKNSHEHGIQWGVAPCFLGWMAVAASSRGICAIELDDDPDALLGTLRKRFPAVRLTKGHDDFTAVVQTVRAFIEKPGNGAGPALDVQGTGFQRLVWGALREISPGTTMTYAEIAARIGRRDAVRAVAGACAANRIAVAIPCHRVLRSDGKLSGYRWGIERKRALLRREGADLGALFGQLE